MRTAGLVLLFLGLIGTVVFGIQALQDSKSFKVLGADVAVSSADWTPVIISAAVLAVGIIVALVAKKR